MTNDDDQTKSPEGTPHVGNGNGAHGGRNRPPIYDENGDPLTGGLPAEHRDPGLVVIGSCEPSGAILPIKRRSK